MCSIYYECQSATRTGSIAGSKFDMCFVLNMILCVVFRIVFRIQNGTNVWDYFHNARGGCEKKAILISKIWLIATLPLVFWKGFFA
jgi:hypothetical protein